MRKNIIRFVQFGILLLALIFTTGCKSSSSNGWKDYFCNIKNVYNIYTGILGNNKSFEPGKSYEITYDFDAEEYTALRDKYNLVEIAGEGTEFDKAVRLMDEFAPRLKHASNYDNHIKSNSLDLLEYSLDQPKNGINCLNKSKILCEMCLACEINARRVHIYPYNFNDSDNHVVIEIYDTSFKKWIMLDMSNDMYFVNKDHVPLSLMEIRNAGAEGTFCTAMKTGYKKSLDDANIDNIYLNTYIMKDVFFMFYDSCNAFGLSDECEYYYLIPKNFNIRNWYMSHEPNKSNYYESYKFNLISEDAILKGP